jgi:signal transduction histidine kinase
MNGQSTSRAEGARAAWVGVGVPVLGLVLVIMVMAVATFAGFAREQDRGFERSSQRLVASAIDGRARALTSVTLDYTNWNEAYDAVTLWDQEWVDGNFYSNAVDGMIIFRANSAVRYTWFANAERPHNAEIQAAVVRAAVATPGLRRLIRSPNPTGMVSRTYVRVGSQLVVVALAPFSREDDSDRLEQAPRSQDFLAIVDVLTPEDMQDIGAGLDLTRLAFSAGEGSGGDVVSLDLSASNGAPVGQLTWRHERPGAAAFQSRVWPVVLGLLLIGALTVLIARLVVARQVAAVAHAGAALESSRAKSEFLARVSHELRTPLNAIVGYAELIEEECDVPETRTDAGRIVTAARQLGHLINDIIDQSRIDSGRMKFNPEPLPVAGMVAEIQGLMGPAARRAGVTFTASSDPAAGFVYADHVRLRQCLLNMLANAVKFSPRGTVSLRATLDCTGQRPMIDFIVQDTGIGMTKDEMSEIFRPFGQANAEIGKRFGGTGLGLSITRELARAMGGEISVVSEPGNGSTFTLAIPAATAAALKAA